VDAAGDAYVIGEGVSVATTANAIAATDTSGYEDFVAELNPTGSALLYATYLPGTINSPNYTVGYSGAIALDGAGNIYVAGAAGTGLPVTANAFPTSANNGQDAFFMKIDPALSGTASVLYASYLGGGGGDQANGIAVDGAGNAYLEGLSLSGSSFPTTSGSLGNAAGFADTFVAKLNSALSGAASLLYSTVLAAHGYDLNEGYGVVPQTMGGIAVDSAGDAYVTGATGSTLTTTPGAF
jgi:hypothetical protein